MRVWLLTYDDEDFYPTVSVEEVYETRELATEALARFEALRLKNKQPGRYEIDEWEVIGK